MGLLKTGAGSIVGAVAIGSIPTLNQPGAETMKSKTFEGLGKVGQTFPTAGKLAGAGLIIKSTRKLSKSSKKLKGGFWYDNT